MSDAPGDAALLRAHVEGDPDAFAELVRRHQDRLWAVAMRTLGERDDAADAVQDALLSACRRAASFRGEAQVSTWLHRIVVNACLDRLRRRRSRPTEALAPYEGLVESRATDTSQTDAIETSERRTDVMTALASLSEEQRTALVLVDMEGFSVTEAAAMVGCAPGTIKSRCARGRVALAPLLTAYRRNRGAANDVEEGSVRPPVDDIHDVSVPDGGTAIETSTGSSS